MHGTHATSTWRTSCRAPPARSMWHPMPDGHDVDCPANACAWWCLHHRCDVMASLTPAAATHGRRQSSSSRTSAGTSAGLSVLIAQELLINGSAARWGAGWEEEEHRTKHIIRRMEWKVQNQLIVQVNTFIHSYCESRLTALLIVESCDYREEEVALQRKMRVDV